jgi:hypothetical protein
MRKSFGAIGLIVLLAPSSAPAQGPEPNPTPIDLSGEWGARTDEDQPHRVPGPELGDYTGLPLNDAARQKAQSWDATILSQPEQQAKPHPAQYSLRGPGPNIRIAKVFDPASRELIAYTVEGMFGRADRIIWLDGRPHPSLYAEHTWAGFSTGKWEANALVVTTTHMKTSFIQRNGAPVSYKSTMTEHLMRHGEYLLIVSVVNDPIYLEEPFIRTTTCLLNPTQNVSPPIPFETVDELGDKPTGWVPHYPLRTRHTEFADRWGLPFQATLGGKETLYPEYLPTLKQLMSKPSGPPKAVPK